MIFLANKVIMTCLLIFYSIFNKVVKLMKILMFMDQEDVEKVQIVKDKEYVQYKVIVKENQVVN